MTDPPRHVEPDVDNLGTLWISFKRRLIGHLRAHRIGLAISATAMLITVVFLVFIGSRSAEEVIGFLAFAVATLVAVIVLSSRDIFIAHSEQRAARRRYRSVESQAARNAETQEWKRQEVVEANARLSKARANIAKVETGIAALDSIEPEIMNEFERVARRDLSRAFNFDGPWDVAFDLGVPFKSPGDFQSVQVIGEPPLEKFPARSFGLTSLLPLPPEQQDNDRRQHRYHYRRAIQWRDYMASGLAAKRMELENDILAAQEDLKRASNIPDSHSAGD
jgi:hypothetical protein